MPQYSSDITITFPGGTPLVGCPNSIRAVSNAVNNSVTQFNTVMIGLQVELGTGVSIGGSITIAVFGSSDGGVTYENNITTNNTLETVFNGMIDGNTLRNVAVLSPVPQFWKLVVRNKTGVAFSATSGNFISVFAGLLNSQSNPLGTAQVSVGTSPTLLASAAINQQGLFVVNNGGSTVYIGTPSVTTSDGLPLLTTQSVKLDNFTDALYGIVASGSDTVGVMNW